jgi:glycosyltransferase involved in cell wall biosynthesis
MRVSLVGNYRGDRNFSMLGFEKALAEQLPKLGVTLEVVFPKPRFGGRGRSPKVDKWLAYVDKFVLFPNALRRQTAGADLVHVCDQGDSIWLRALRDRRHLVTCHDMLSIRAARGEMPGWSVGRTGKLLQSAIFANLAKAQNVAFDSKATQSDFLRLTGRSTGTSMVEIGLFRDLERMEAGEARRAIGELTSQPLEPFILHLGGNQPYKNRLGLIQIYRELIRVMGSDCPRLAMAGIPPSPEIIEAAGELIEQGRIVPIHLPTDQQINALYSLAEALVFPSLYEGFGMPIIEAQTCGCPVFTSGRAPLSDLGGDCAVYFDPDNPASAAETIGGNWGRRSEMSQAGLEYSVKWLPHTWAARYLETYKSILG